MSKQNSKQVGNLNNQKVHNNKYDNLLILLLSMQIFGGLGGSLQPIRVFIFLCIPFTIGFFLKNKQEMRYYQYQFFLYIFWILYGLLTLIWAIDLLAGIKEILYLNINFLSILTIFFFARKANNPQISIIKGWILFLVLSLPFALFEIFYNIHLPSSFAGASETIRGAEGMRRFASLTFGNLNSYNVRIVYSIPYIFALLFVYKKNKQSILIWGILLITFYVLITNASRAAVICMVISMITFIIYFMINKVNKAGIILVASSTIILLFFFFKQLFLEITFRFGAQGFVDKTRLEIILKSLQLLLEKFYFFGVGSGNFQATMEANYNLPINAPHNLFIEILVSYGLIIFILFMGLFLRIFNLAYKNSSSFLRYAVFTSLLVFPIVSVINSSYISGISVWLQISSLYVIADNRVSIIK